MKRINTWADTQTTGKAIVDLGDGIQIPLPVDGVFPGKVGPAGAGVPTGGAPRQVIRKTATGETTEWVTLSKAEVGLSNVDNTPDTVKPVSAPQAEALAGKADLVGGKVPSAQLPTITPVTDSTIAPLINGATTGAAIDARINQQVAPQVQHLTASYIAGDRAVVDAAAAAVNAAPKIVQLETVAIPKALTDAKTYTDGARWLRPALGTSATVDALNNLTVSGIYLVASPATATNLGLPDPGNGTVEHIEVSANSADQIWKPRGTRKTYRRSRGGSGWGPFGDVTPSEATQTQGIETRANTYADARKAEAISAASVDATSKANAAQAAAIADAGTKYGALPSRVTSVESRSSAQAGTLDQHGARIGSLEVIAGLEPGNISDSTVAGVVSNPTSASRAALDSSYSKVMPTSQTVRIPTDYPTLQGAVDALSTNAIRQGATIVLNIEAGYRPTSGIIVTGGDYSQFRVTSTDAVVTVAETFTGPFIRGQHASLPRLGCLVDMLNKGEEGYGAWDNSNGFIEPRSGVRNAGTRGCHVRGSRVFAPGSEFTGSGNRNLHITGGAFFDGDAGNYSANKATVESGNRAIYVSRESRASLMGAKITDTKGEAAIQAIRSQVSAEGADVSRAETVGIKASGAGTVSFAGGVANNCGAQAINASGASIVDAEAAKLNDAGVNAILASTGGRVNAWRAEVLRAGSTSVLAGTGSNINARDCDATGHAGSSGFAVTSGSIINANGAIGVKNQPVNTITSAGIIFG